ncbi:MAG: aldo/keto reductase [Bacteroidales bacterium]|jgi:predicted aldo/keto reductase-like oxidoreductase
MNRTNRRNFIRTGLAGAAGVMAFSPAMYGESSKPDDRKIITRKLGKTRLIVPVISFGVMRADNPSLCKAAYDNGITMFDTANGYQNGNNETMLGNLFKELPRKSFILETKVKAAGVGRDGKPTGETTAEDFLQKFNTSLSRLHMDYVDILFIHDISNPEMLEYKPILSALEKLKKQKKTRFVGFSTHNNMAAVIDAAASSDRWDVILSAYNFKINNLNEVNAALKKANQAGIGIVAMKTMAGGGFLDKEKTKPINASAALKWALSNNDVSTAIPGMTTFDHLETNLRILADITMTEQEKGEILAAVTIPGMYCSGCNSCSGRCPSGLPVPELMRAYMYAYGYSNLPMAYALLGELGTGSSPCINCDSCTVECRSRFNVREKIADVSRLVNVPSDFIV